MIKMEEVTKSFGTLKVLNGITMEIGKGDIYGLVGTSGAGKSTLLRCINGLQEYNSGSLKVEGVEVHELDKEGLRELRRGIGMIFQDFSILERMTVYENVGMPMKCWGYDQAHIDQRVKEVLEMVGLTDKAEARPRELSGGQKQRVAIARAIAMEPKILLCDEATSALDPHTAKTILEILKSINERLGITVVVVAHQMEVVKQVCDKIAILEHGVLKADGAVADIFFEDPQSLQNLLGEDCLETLPDTGFNIKMSFQEKDKTSEALLATLAIETGIRFSYVWGGINRFKDDKVGMVTLNVKHEHELRALRRVLESNEIKHKVI